MGIKELRKLKKALIKANTQTREHQVFKALKTIFHDENTGLTDEEAFRILDWNYKSKEELFGEYNKDQIIINEHEDSLMIFNATVKELPEINGVNVIEFFDELGIE